MTKMTLAEAVRSAAIEGVIDALEAAGAETYIWVNTDKATRVPERFVNKDGWIALDITSDAASELTVENGWISFVADFPGAENFCLAIPVGRVKRIGSPDTDLKQVDFVRLLDTTPEMVRRAPYAEEEIEAPKPSGRFTVLS